MLQSSNTTSITPIPLVGAADLQVLLLDDSRFDCQRIRRLAAKADFPVELDDVNSIDAMDRAVQKKAYDLILIDYRLPVGDGMEALDHVLQAPKNRDAAKIMITGNGAMETAVQALRRGCHDFLSKADLDADMLHTAMMNALTLAGQRQEIQQHVQREALHEGLVSALQDKRVRDNLATLIRQQVGQTGPAAATQIAGLPSYEFDLLIAGLNETDEFIFH